MVRKIVENPVQNKVNKIVSIIQEIDILRTKNKYRVSFIDTLFYIYTLYNFFEKYLGVKSKF